MGRGGHRVHRVLIFLVGDDMERDFKKDVVNHKMEVVVDNGVHRHLTFRNPKCFSMWFDIVTWPGHLTICGDMGCYVFRRVHDMFTFFRDRDNRPNFGYWAEKIVANERNGGHEEFSEKLFEKRVREWAKDYSEDFSPKKKKDLMACIDEEIFEWIDDLSPEERYRRVIEFEYEGKNIFQDFWEVNSKEYTVHYRWCCYAIPWAIRMYDEAKKEVGV